ncbi:flagellin [Gammaproteobacteria bacterium]|jgi:flagellin|nr:flagellin [Gammaproteobacteria bacterium]
MSLVVNTNIASMNAQRSLSTSGRELQTAMERLSSGKKINSAADDAAGFAIAEGMTAQIRGLAMASKNAGDGISLLKVVENATNDVTDMLQRVRELAVQAKSGTNSTSDVANLQKEAESLMDEITRVSEDTTFNGVKYIGTEAGTKSIQVGYKDGDAISITTNKVDSMTLGIVTDGDADGVNDAGEYLDISSATALATITSAIDTVAGYKAGWGASQNRLEYTVSNLMNVVEFTSAARSRIEDADFAVEAARLAKSQVLQQTGAAMLAQANASPQLALSLLS